jgi:hypothetical protein
VFRSVAEAEDLPSGGWHFSRITSAAWKRGQPVEVSDYNNAGQKQRVERSAYSFLDADTTARYFRGLAARPFVGRRFGSENYSDYTVVSAWAYQSADSTFTYDETGAASLVTARRYDYENPTHLQLTRITETNSDGTLRVTRMKYPADYADGSGNSEAVALTAMKRDSVHMHSPVIERWVSDSVGGAWRVVRADLTAFQLFNTGQYLPRSFHVLKRSEAVTNFVPSSISGSFTKDSRYSTTQTAGSYDVGGRLTSYTDRWGYATSVSYGFPTMRFCRTGSGSVSRVPSARVPRRRAVSSRMCLTIALGM